MPITIVIASPILQLVSISMMMFIGPQASEDPRETTENLLNLLLILQGIAYTIKLAVFPQVMPYVIKEEVKLESANAFTQAADHMLTCFILVLIGVLEEKQGKESKVPIFMMLTFMTLVSLFFYVWFFIFDKYRKNSMLDMKQLGSFKSYDIIKSPKQSKPRVENDSPNVIYAPSISVEQLKTQRKLNFSNYHQRSELNLLHDSELADLYILGMRKSA